MFGMAAALLLAVAAGVAQADTKVLSDVPQWCESGSTPQTAAGGELTAASMGDLTTLRTNPIDGVPDYKWWYGCSPTSGGMIVGYWDGQSGYGNLFDGDASTWYGSGSSGTKSMVAGTAHITAGSENGYTYGDWHNSTSYPNHESNPDCIADFMKTVDGGSYDSNIGAGLEAYIEWDNPNTAINESYQATVTHDYISRYGGGWNYNSLKAEIDAGRPVLLGAVTLSYEGTTELEMIGHSIVAYGYQDDMFTVDIPGVGVQIVGGFAVMDTWSDGTGGSTWVDDSMELLYPIIDENDVEWWPYIEYAGYSWTYGEESYGPYDWMITDGFTINVMVPEPASMSLMALGTLALLRRRRK